MKLWLPFPPSVNGLYPGKVRRYKSDEYKEWIKEAGKILLLQKPFEYFDMPVFVMYSYGRPDKRIRDVLNYEKAVSDLLVAHGILKDDCLIEDARIRWKDITGCEIIIVKMADYQDQTANLGSPFL